MLKHKLQIIFAFLALNIALGYAQKRQDEIQYYDISNSESYAYKKPKFFDMIKFIPNDIAEFGMASVSKQYFIWTSAALGATALIIPFDQQLVDASIDLGSNINFDAGHSYSNIGPLRVVPNDINSAVYYIGNGGTTMLLSGVFYAFGALGKDYRALNTSSELVEALLSLGVITQTIKRVTGRQSPGPAMESGNPGGHWRLFPSLKNYQSQTSNYDAMPSGHVATFMATIIVIAENYPEIRWIKPVGYSLMGIMAFEMMSSKVHWASDYPLALLIGYIVGKKVVDRRVAKFKKNDLGEASKIPKVKTDFNLGRIASYSTFGVQITF